jgi:hypothetical protein
MRLKAASVAIAVTLTISMIEAQQTPELKTVLHNAADALGMLRTEREADLIATLRYWGAGTMTVGGQMVKVTNYAGSVNFHVPGMRVDVTRTAADGKPQRAVEVVSDKFAWNETQPGMNATPAAAAVNDRLLQLWTLPQGIVKAATAAGAAAKVTAAGRHHAHGIASSDGEGRSRSFRDVEWDEWAGPPWPCPRRSFLSMRPRSCDPKLRPFVCRGAPRPSAMGGRGPSGRRPDRPRVGTVATQRACGLSDQGPPLAGPGYVVSVVIGSVGALALAPLAGRLCHPVGFGLLAVLWLTATLQGYRRIRARTRCHIAVG